MSHRARESARTPGTTHGRRPARPSPFDPQSGTGAKHGRQRVFEQREQHDEADMKRGLVWKMLRQLFVVRGRTPTHRIRRWLALRA